MITLKFSKNINHNLLNISAIFSCSIGCLIFFLFSLFNFYESIVDLENIYSNLEGKIFKIQEYPDSIYLDLLIDDKYHYDCLVNKFNKKGSTNLKVNDSVTVYFISSNEVLSVKKKQNYIVDNRSAYKKMNLKNGLVSLIVFLVFLSFVILIAKMLKKNNKIFGFF